MEVRKIHQFSFACSSGDGVTNSLFYIQKLLRELGFESEIFSETIPDDLRHRVRDFSLFQDDKDAILLAHHCMGYDNSRWLLSLHLPKVMVYHNITPIDMLPEDGDIRRWAMLGRDQLRDWAPKFLGAIGVSQLNSQELESNGYANIATIPMLVDFDKLRAHKPDFAQLQDLRDTYNILFVGRVCENKRQLELIEMIHHLRHRTRSPVRLILAGAVTSGTYQALIEQRIRELSLEQYVVRMGKVSDEVLAALYRIADQFMCLSAHEGFGMPLIEAMQYKIPVIARMSSNIADTLGIGGILLDSTASAWDCANAAFNLMQEPALRRHVVKQQDLNLERFSKETVRRQLREYLSSIGIRSFENQQVEDQKEAALAVQIEGPFDSNYSLAVVNRELARAMSAFESRTGLRSHEGTGDFLPSVEFLGRNPDLKRLHENSTSSDVPPRTALRFCYPPYLDNMPAGQRIVHSYGWEETGFPIAYVEEFNRRADAISVLSPFVAKVLRDSGVRVPIVVTGAGVDHLLRLEKVPLRAAISKQAKSFRFLHVSSCFPRKAVDVLLHAYAKAFRASDDVTLIIKTFENIHNTVVSDLEDMRRDDADFPHVIVVTEDLPEAELAALYTFADAFVAPSRGEGLGLPLAEAMLFERPVITTGWGGQTYFCTEQTAWLCDYQLSKAATHMGLTHSLWAEPDLAHLAELMRRVFEAPQSVIQQKVSVARELVMSNFTWLKTAERIRKMISDLEAEPVLRKQAKIAWISTWNSRCGIANYSQFLTEYFPQNRLCILANHVAERMSQDQENVIRCWTTGEKTQLDYLMAEIEERDLEVVVIQYNFSFFSLALLSKMVETLKSRGKQIHLFLHSTADVTVPGHENTLTSILSSLHLLDRIYVHGVDDVNRLKAWGLIENVCFFPHGISLPSSPILMEPDPQVTTIGSYGFLLPHKGILELIEAFSLLDHQQKEYRLLLLNSIYPVSVSTDLENQCRDLINRLGLHHKVKLVTEFLPEAETLMRLSRCDLIVFPYQHTQESSSAAVRVGLATNRPVAVTPLAIFDDVADAVFKLPGTSAREIAAGIDNLLMNKEALDLKVLEAQRWVEERHWPQLSERLLGIIDGISNSW